jgi:hypothetical protein
MKKFSLFWEENGGLILIGLFIFCCIVYSCKHPREVGEPASVFYTAPAETIPGEAPEEADAE